MNHQPTLQTLIVGHYGQYPFTTADLTGAKQASMTEPDEDGITTEQSLVWEEILSVDTTQVLLSVSGAVQPHRIRAIRTAQVEEEPDIQARLEALSEIDDYGFDRPFELN